MTASKDSKDSFSEKVWHVVCAIPKGHVLSYAAVAKRAGFSGAARAVGTLMKKNFDPERPCHRVIRSDGGLGEYNRGTLAKARFLRSEGVVIRNHRVVASEK